MGEGEKKLSYFILDWKFSSSLARNILNDKKVSNLEGFWEEAHKN